jgi:hypothetical protein
MAQKATEILWPFTTRDVVYGWASQCLAKLNTRAINEKFYLRATDETRCGQASMGDQAAVFVNHPEYLRARVRKDCESILNQWTFSFAARNGMPNAGIPTG